MQAPGGRNDAGCLLVDLRDGGRCEVGMRFGLLKDRPGPAALPEKAAPAPVSHPPRSGAAPSDPTLPAARPGPARNGAGQGSIRQRMRGLTAGDGPGPSVFQAPPRLASWCLLLLLPSTLLRPCSTSSRTSSAAEARIE